MSREKRTCKESCSYPSKTGIPRTEQKILIIIWMSIPWIRSYEIAIRDGVYRLEAVIET